MRILLVEDEDGVASFIQKGLEEEGFTVDRAEDGEVGEHMGTTERYDMMVLDVNLPGMDGFTLCRRLRSEGVHAPVLMLTVKSGVKDKVKGLDSGADDYLTKPFSFEEFLARIRALLRRRDSEVLEYRLGRITLDIVAHRVYVDGQVVELRPKEYAILEFLMRNRGRIISRTQILSNIWGYDFDPGTNVLDVHVKTLRDRLKEVGEEDVIRTVRGMGYVIEKGEDD